MAVSPQYGCKWRIIPFGSLDGWAITWNEKLNNASESTAYEWDIILVSSRKEFLEFICQLQNNWVDQQAAEWNTAMANVSNPEEYCGGGYRP